MHLAPHFDLKQKGLSQRELFRDQRDPQGVWGGTLEASLWQGRPGLLAQRRAGGACGR